MPFGIPSTPPPDPPAITPGLMVVMPRGISGCTRCTPQYRSSSRIRSEHVDGLLDRGHRLAATAGVDRAVADGAVAGAPADHDAHPLQPALDRLQVAVGRLEHDRRVGQVAPLDRARRARPARLLVDDRLEHDVAAQADAEVAQDAQRDDAAGDPALHVARRRAPRAGPRRRAGRPRDPPARPPRRRRARRRRGRSGSATGRRPCRPGGRRRPRAPGSASNRSIAMPSAASSRSTRVLAGPLGRDGGRAGVCRRPAWRSRTGARRARASARSARRGGPRRPARMASVTGPGRLRRAPPTGRSSRPGAAAAPARRGPSAISRYGSAIVRTPTSVSTTARPQNGDVHLRVAALVRDDEPAVAHLVRHGQDLPVRARGSRRSASSARASGS